MSKQRRASVLSKISNMSRAGPRGSITEKRVAVVRYMPTYRLEAKNPFNREIAEDIMKKIMAQVLAGFTFSSKKAQSLCKNISEEIKFRIKFRNFDRYKYVCVVTIGERFMQGFNMRTTYLWDAEKDGFVSHVYDTPNFFAIATLYYTYYD